MHEMQALETKTCPTVNTHRTKVSVPVCISPFATPGPVSIECCGNPEISNGFDQCIGIINGGCEFTISQTMRIDIPVVFGAGIRIGDAYVNCNAASCGTETECLCYNTADAADVEINLETGEA